MKDAPHPKAARLFVSFMFSSRIKVLTTDPIEHDNVSEEIRAKYAQYFDT